MSVQAVRLIVFAFTGFQLSEKVLQNFVKFDNGISSNFQGTSLDTLHESNLLTQVLVEHFVFLLKFKSCSPFSSTESAFAKLSPTAEAESACWVELSGCSSMFTSIWRINVSTLSIDSRSISCRNHKISSGNSSLDSSVAILLR